MKALHRLTFRLVDLGLAEVLDALAQEFRTAVDAAGHGLSAVAVDAVRVLDDAGKTVARLEASAENSPTAADGSSRDHETPVDIYLFEVRGYDDWQKVRALLHRQFGLEPIAVAQEANLDSTAGDWVRRILREQFDTLKAYEEGARRGDDPEALHNFRVAIRRSRTAMSRLPGVLPADTVARAGADFKWLGGLTGVVRDLDVHLLKMPDYEADLPETVRADLAPLRRHLERRRTTEQARLVGHLDSPRYRRLVTDWPAFLESDVADARADCPRADLPVRQVASIEIWRIYAKILKRGRKITDSSPDDDVHDLRKDCKKLRYLLEFFRDLYPQGDMESSIKALKRLQDVLGDFNDFSVQRETLSHMAEDLHEQQDVPAATLLAMGRLVGHFEDWQQAERNKFAAAFKAFVAKGVTRRYRQLFRQPS